ncbi:MAG: hypothetical protein Q4F88_06275 [Eubacteriales bacterium]|nr:hypothetical protein [Eubacteriales bacterium]
MQTKGSKDFISNREWLTSATQNENIILRGVSALEYLQLFVGYYDEENIDVYAKNVGFYSNIQYHIVDSFDNIEYFKQNNVLCSTFNQAIKDILSDSDGDTQALVESLSRYYTTHNESFDGLQVLENKEEFEELKIWAKNYYSDGVE